jgi:hypothetical protein
MILDIINESCSLLKGDYLLYQVVLEVMDLTVSVVEVSKAIIPEVLDKPIVFCIISPLFIGLALSNTERYFSSMKYH